MADVFIIYAVKSSMKFAALIAAALENDGITCSFSELYASGLSNSLSKTAFEEAIQLCKVLLLLDEIHFDQNGYMTFKTSLSISPDSPEKLRSKAILSLTAKNDNGRFEYQYFVTPKNLSDNQLIVRIMLIIARLPKPTTIQTWERLTQPSLTKPPDIKDIFISYHVSDSATPFVRNLARTLESAGNSCWYAPRNVTPGEFVDSILEALDKCKIFLLLLDEGANPPGYVYNETVEAYNLYKEENHPILLPFQIGKFQIDRKLKFYLGPFHIIYGGDSFETADTTELIAKITDTLNKL